MTKPHERIEVVFRPAGQSAYVLPGTLLTEAAATVGLAINYPCGGRGTCGKCRVRIIEGNAPAGDGDIRALSRDEIADGWRLACQTPVFGPMVVQWSSAATSAAQILTKTVARQGRDADRQPLIEVRPVELPPPTRGDDRPDLMRLEAGLGVSLRAGPAVLRVLGRQLADWGYRGTALLRGDELIDFVPEASPNALVAAADLGTTTLAAALIDARSEQDLAVAARLNPQRRFGDDVLSRIQACIERPDSLAEMSAAVIEAINDMIDELCRKVGTPPDAICELTIAGNTTMQQLALGISPAGLGRVPFAPVMARGVEAAAAELGISIHPRGRIYVFPVIGGFVGGDTVAGLLACGLTGDSGPSLLVDIGTNGEIVVWDGRRLTAASTAAGPAFEGARILHGMHGADGAIEKVVFDGELQCNTIGSAAARGICGSGLIDLAAELLRLGLLTPQGRLLSAEQAPAGTPPSVRGRLIEYEGKSAFLLVKGEQSQHGRPIVVTQRDFRELQLAAGAIRAGISILLSQAGLKAEHLQRVVVAGGFGNYIRRHNAQRIGLLPPQLAAEQIRYEGNTSLAGARMAALCRAARQSAEELARQTDHVDLSTSPQFASVFAESMLFPERESN